MAERQANAEMIDGFRDGYDLSAPEPSANRSASYRHGFMCGRNDKHPGPLRAGYSYDELVRMANEAMDADQQTPGA